MPTDNRPHAFTESAARELAELARESRTRPQNPRIEARPQRAFPQVAPVLLTRLLSGTQVTVNGWDFYEVEVLSIDFSTNPPTVDVVDPDALLLDPADIP